MWAPAAGSTPSAMPLKHKGPLEKRLLPGLEQEMCETSLKFPVVPESKKALEKQTRIDGRVKGHGSQVKALPKAK